MDNVNTAINTILIYTPTSDASDDEIETFYIKLQEEMDEISKQEILIIRTTRRS